LAKWYSPLSLKEKQRALQHIEQNILTRRRDESTFLPLQDRVLAWRQYASVFFVSEIDQSENPLLALELIHRFCVILDQYFGRVSELDLIFNFDRAYLLLDNFLLDGKLVDSSAKAIVEQTKTDDVTQAAEIMDEALAESIG